MSENLNVILNGEIVSGIRGESILELARRHGIEIPTLCHDPRLEPYTSCYLCVVEVDGLKGLQPSCSTKIAEGMNIKTDNERIFKARKTALDLLVSNHYADCLGPCKQTCPAGVDVQGYISLIEKGKYHEAVALIKETNPLPAICGRVCVRPCEVACRRNLLDEGAPVGIDYLKRFASDIDLNSADKWKPLVKPPTGKKVAVIGAGPAGVSCGFFLQKEGHQVDIFEAAPQAGGWLRYGIPEYRLPNDILQKEVDNITELGVNIFYQKKLGDNLNFCDLKDNYDATILTIGSQKGTIIGCEGEDAENVFSGIDFLKQMELTGVRYDLKGKTVAVVGGGNTAMDCCRSSIRCGADKVYVIYRRTEKEMPANPIEIHESKLEGVEYMFLSNPVSINKTVDGKVKSVTCIRMELGPPDASGRRRPVPVENSEFEVQVDVILAAIGQKTVVNFLDNVNSCLDNGEQLKASKWGDIEANPKTLQTGVSNIFAAGDGVTGPATLIEAIAQARLASYSCDLYLKGKPVVPMKQEFLSRKENFKEQVKDDYVGFYKKQLREEMPTLAPQDRINFQEVELGYASEEVALHETQRCLECGCTAIYKCDLKKYSTQYDADQKRYAGEFKEFHVDFRHPYIEIDNNKCILCSRCIRICREVVGADALGLVYRGFETFVAPSMGEALTDTPCESCGLCISTCPTGAISENVIFKPGPVRLEKAETICNYCSVGCAINYEHKGQFVMGISGAEGLVNGDGNLCRYAKFGYNYLNSKERITKPLLRAGDRFEEISFERAYEIIRDNIKKVNPDENAFFAGARLTNEEIYLVQKLARLGAKTHNVASFHYLNRGDGYRYNADANVPFDQIRGASKIYLLGSEINEDNAVAGFMINNTQVMKNVPVELITVRSDSSMKHKADTIIKVNSYYYFVKAVNHYLVSHGLHNGLFIKDRCADYDKYKQQLLNTNYEELVMKSGIQSREVLETFAREFNEELNAILVYSEKEVSSNACHEIRNLAMLTGKLGKTSNGLISLKEKNNSQGLLDMGACMMYGVGSALIDDPAYKEKVKRTWNVQNLPKFRQHGLYNYLENKSLKNIFIFGEDPVGCAEDRSLVQKWFSAVDFLVVQDYFMTETASQAHLILPASLPVESGGSFTNTQKVIQEFDAQFTPSIEKLSWQQLSDMLMKLGHQGHESIQEILTEALSLLTVKSDEERFKFTVTEIDNQARMFKSGCDHIVDRFEAEFRAAHNYRTSYIEPR